MIFEETLPEELKRLGFRGVIAYEAVFYSGVKKTRKRYCIITLEKNEDEYIYHIYVAYRSKNGALRSSHVYDLFIYDIDIPGFHLISCPSISGVNELIIYVDKDGDFKVFVECETTFEFGLKELGNIEKISGLRLWMIDNVEYRKGLLKKFN